jgi:hypothetical protein
MAVAEFVVIRLSLAVVALWLIVLATRTNAVPTLHLCGEEAMTRRCPLDYVAGPNSISVIAPS